MNTNREESIAMGRKAAWVVALVFLVMIGGPAVWRNGSELVKGRDGWVPVIEMFRYEGPTLAEHLAAFERRLERESEFAESARRWMQGVVTRVFREGNRKVLIGKDGWLYYRPEMEAMTGKSPWDERLKIVRRFEEQLEEMGVELIEVDVPPKSVVYPQGLDAGETNLGLEPPEFMDAINAGGRQPFLKQDTHWTPEAMEAVVERVAGEIRGRSWFRELEAEEDRFHIDEIKVSAFGDLVDMLGLARPEALFDKETVTVRRVIDRETGRPVALDNRDSPIVLLGDSSVNIYGNDNLGFGSGGGFGHHLARKLGMPLDVIAIDGQGATGVRRVLADRPGSATTMREKKKAVIWVTVSRDFRMPENRAREEGIVWEDVEFNERAMEAPAKEIVVEARLVAKSRIPDPRETTYADAIYSAVYAVEGVVAGEYAKTEVLVYHWAFRKRELEPASRYEVGEQKRLRLVPLVNKEEEKSMNRSDDFDARFDLPAYWADEVTAVTE